MFLEGCLSFSWWRFEIICAVSGYPWPRQSDFKRSRIVEFSWGDLFPPCIFHLILSTVPFVHSASPIGLPGPKPPIICKYRRGVILLRPLFPQFPEISRWAPNYGWPAGACLSARSPTIGRNLTASSPGYFWATAPIGPQSWQKAVQKPKIAQAEPMPGIGCQGGGNWARPPPICNHSYWCMGWTQFLSVFGVEIL